MLAHGVRPLVVALALALPVAFAKAQYSCFEWESGFGPIPGVDGSVYCMSVFDDGTGPKLYLGGLFRRAGNATVNGFACFDGESWFGFGSGLGSSGFVQCMKVFDDGTGPALYIAGTFDTVDLVSARSIAKFDGRQFSPLAGGVGVGAPDRVLSLGVFDDGAGAALYVGGAFSVASRVSVSNIAKWNGHAWSDVGGGTDGEVDALVSFNDHGHTSLYAGGDFTLAGGVAARRVARWDGHTWTPLSSGMDRAVYSLVVFDDGVSRALYAGGSFRYAGGVRMNGISRWNGSAWSDLAGGTGGGFVAAFRVVDDAGGPALVVGGQFSSIGGTSANNIARWNGSAFTSLGTGISSRPASVFALATIDTPSGSRLFTAGANIVTVGDRPVQGIAQWDGSDWSDVGPGFADRAGSIFTMASLDVGAGPALYAGGAFTSAGAVDVDGLAKWDGRAWAPIGNPRSGSSPFVYALTALDGGTPRRLCIGGAFESFGGVAARNIATWDGLAWSPLGTGVDGTVRVLAMLDDGNGRSLFVGGEFLAAGDSPASRIATWTGSEWVPLGSGLDGVGVVAALSLAEYDDGTGPGLYVGGQFATAGGQAASNIARWNGTSWSAVGGGANNSITSLVVFDDGTGPALYAGGAFTSIGGVATGGFAKWDGARWTPLGTNTSVRISALASSDMDAGAAIYAAGHLVDTPQVFTVGRWAGTHWANLDSDLPPFDPSTFTAIAAFDDGAAGQFDGSGPALYVGGNFSRVGHTPSYKIARRTLAPRRGNVNASAGPVADVLEVNGSTGDATRTVDVAIDAPISISLAAAPAGPLPARYTVWIWRNAVDRPTPLVAGGARIGCTVDPTHFAPDTTPQPFACVTSPFRPCGSIRTVRSPSTAPLTVRRAVGWPTTETFTVQGVIEDANAPAGVSLSVTNSVTLRIR
ncbi:MAG: hypothetical protein HYR85_20940 [Planctomycetes bacterium]|nr:hypothetical protein [Planctomycetota bacterium]MBI3844904.1 hypothetical protein [Planctomycetota bacterium]